MMLDGPDDIIRQAAEEYRAARERENEPSRRGIEIVDGAICKARDTEFNGAAPRCEVPGGRAADLKAEIQLVWDIRPRLESGYLVKGWIDRGASSVLYGDSNVGKSFFALAGC